MNQPVFNQSSSESMTNRRPNQQTLEHEVARLVVDALLRCGLDPSQCEASLASRNNLDPTSTLAPTSIGSDVAGAPVVDPNPVRPNDLTIDANVISVGLLSTLSIGDQRLAFTQNAVITPAAKDWLREKRVVWCRGGQESKELIPEHSNAGTQLTKTAWLYDSDQPAHAIGFAKQLSIRGIAIAAVQDLAEVSEGVAPGIVLSSFPAVDVDAWGRGRGYRVAAVDSLASIPRIAALLAPQIWIIDKSRLPFQGRVSIALQCIRASHETVTSSRAALLEMTR